MTPAIKSQYLNDAQFHAIVESMRRIIRVFPRWRIDQATLAATELNESEDLPKAVPKFDSDAANRAAALIEPVFTD